MHGPINIRLYYQLSRVKIISLSLPCVLHATPFLRSPFNLPWNITLRLKRKSVLEWKQNVVAHAQKPDLVFQRNGRVHFYRRGCKFSRLLAAEVCASAVVMLDRPCPIQGKAAGYPLHSPFSPSLLHPCVSVCHQIPFLLYVSSWKGRCVDGLSFADVWKRYFTFTFSRWFVDRGSTSFPKISEQPRNSRRQNGDMKQAAY